MKCLLEPQQQDLPPHNCSLIDNWFRDVGGVLREEHVVLMAEETDEDDEFRIILFLHFLVSSPASELAVRPKFYHLCFHFLFFFIIQLSPSLSPIASEFTLVSFQKLVYLL